MNTAETAFHLLFLKECLQKAWYSRRMVNLIRHAGSRIPEDFGGRHAVAAFFLGQFLPT